MKDKLMELAEGNSPAWEFNRMNGLLCTFGMAWKLDGDYLRCRKCDRPQLTNYADHEFPHAADCKARHEVEKHPWISLLDLLKPLIAAHHADAEGDGGAVDRDVLAVGVRARNIEITRQQRAGEPNNEDHALRIGIAAALATYPARSGVVSDEDVEAALKIWNDAPALGRDEDDAYAMRAALTHFAQSPPTHPHSPDAADSGRVTRDVLAIGVRARNIEITRQQRAGEASNEDHALRIGIAAALAAQGQGEPDPMEAIVQHCMVTEAVSPDSADPYGTISRVIDWNQANTASTAGVPDGIAIAAAERGLWKRAAANMRLYDGTWLELVREVEKLRAAPSAPEGGEVE